MPRLRGSAAIVLLLGSNLAAGQSTSAGPPQATKDALLGEIVVAAPYGYDIARDRVPANVQTATAEDFRQSQALDLTDFMNRELGSVSINQAQNNPLQPDVNFRGFTASPLLGLAQGLAVYENGVRINEPFGDTVNWDLISLSSISAIQLPWRQPVRIEHAGWSAVAADEERLQLPGRWCASLRRLVRPDWRGGGIRR